MEKEIITTSKDEQIWDIVNAKERLELNHNYLIHISDISTNTKSDFCSTVYRLRYFFENPKNDLQREISERKKKLVTFSDEEITILCSQVTNAAAWLAQHNRFIGEISPLYIIAPKATEQEIRHYKLVDKFWNDFDPKEICTQKIAYGQDLYCAPEVFNAVHTRKNDVRIDKSKNDAFSLGMTLLEAGTLQGIQNCYPSDHGEVFNVEKLKVVQKSII